MNILIVDDEELMVRALSRHLKFEACRVYTASDMEQAKHMLSHQFMDVVVTDMDLGEGSQHGRSLLKWVEEYSPMTRRVLMSGTQFTSQTAPEAQHVLHKPFLFDELKHVMTA